ncbi:MAG: MBL fold metallo-hydrolase, partial [Cyanobacteriota bacterium]|nr:MBL fold metallo-hydrolase [Cyanobacteriota bacterium]
GLRLLWTPGPTPGSCVVFAPDPWNVLFCGRLLIPFAFVQLSPLAHRRTFHWPRQLRSLQKLRQWIPSNARPVLASGAHLGALRGKKLAPWDAWKLQANQ